MYIPLTLQTFTQDQVNILPPDDIPMQTINSQLLGEKGSFVAFFNVRAPMELGHYPFSIQLVYFEVGEVATRTENFSGRVPNTDNRLDAECS